MTLDQMYEKPSPSNKVFIMRHLINLNMSEGGSIAYHFNEFNMVTSHLNSIRVNFGDEVSTFFIVCSSLKRYNGFCSNTLKFHDVVGAIPRDEMSQKIINEMWRNILTIENRVIQRERGNIPRNHGKSEGKSKYRRRIECWHYEKKWHEGILLVSKIKKEMDNKRIIRKKM